MSYWVLNYSEFFWIFCRIKALCMFFFGIFPTVQLWLQELQKELGVAHRVSFRIGVPGPTRLRKCAKREPSAQPSRAWCVAAPESCAGCGASQTSVRCVVYWWCRYREVTRMWETSWERLYSQRAHVFFLQSRVWILWKVPRDFLHPSMFDMALQGASRVCSLRIFFRLN